MPSYLGTKEKEFIRDLSEWDIVKLHKKYTSSYRRVMKYRLLQKKRFLAQDLLTINSVLEKLQTLWVKVTPFRDKERIWLIEWADTKVLDIHLDER